MLREIPKSNIHNATVTKKELYYEGSIGIDENVFGLHPLFFPPGA